MKHLLQFLFSHRTLALLRWDLHMLRVRCGNAITRAPRKFRRFVSNMPSPVFLNLGSGPRGLDDQHWVNVDGFRETNVHFLLDFTRPIPIDDCSLDGVFCEHVLEHFSIDDGRNIMREIRRILKPDGVVRIVVPDATWVMRAYFDRPEALVCWRHGKDGAGAQRTPMEVVNEYFRQRYEHQFLYDFITMEAMLKEAGFSDVRLTGFRRSSMCEALVLDDPKYEPESLYVEARR